MTSTYRFLKFLTVSSVLGLTACSPSDDWQQLNGVSYSRGGEACAETKNHWLLDLQAKNGNDSLYLSTKELGRKLELHKLRLDTSTTVYSLIGQTCPGDSIMMRLKASDFYSSLGGVVPPHLDTNEQIAVKVNMVDQLTDIEHIMYKKVFESNAMERYVRSLRWNSTRDSATGITYEILKQNPTGKKVNKKAKVSYVIKNVNEQLIARSMDDNPLLYSKEDREILKGIHFLVAQLREGESLRAVLPSDQAYGADGNSKVPGYSPILIDLELKEVVD